MDHRERAESIVSWSGLHLKYNVIFFYAGAGESASCQFFLQPRHRGLQHFSLPENSENSGKCISITLSTHVETVCLLSKLHEAKHHVNVRLDMDELDITSAESKATYEEIKSYVAEHNEGMKVSNLYIAQVKAKYGIIERENYNKPKLDDARQPKCPNEKEEAIVDAMEHFKMI